MHMPAPSKHTHGCRDVSEVLNRIGEKWTAMVVVALREHPRRFNDIKRHVIGISQQMLTRTLRTLERDGFVGRTVFPANPPQVEYALTDLGKSLADPLHYLARWVNANIEAIHAHQMQFDADRARVEGED